MPSSAPLQHHHQCQRRGGGIPILSACSVLISRLSLRDDTLQRAAVRCMMELMQVSPAYCRKQLRLLFTVLRKSRDDAVR